MENHSMKNSSQSIPLLKDISAVCFDAFGTLFVTKSLRQSPYLWIAKRSQLIPNTLREDFLTTNKPLSHFIEKLSLNEHSYYLNEILDIELNSLQLYPEVLSVMDKLKSLNKRIAVCSNIAFSYGAKMKTLLPSNVEQTIFSYEAGFYKPQPQIYKAVCERLKLPPKKILFIGDSARADFAGPKAFGMNALLLKRDLGDTLNSILGLAISN